MSIISNWSTVANDNGTLGSTPQYWPEGQAPSTVNNCARLMMATIRTQFNDCQWFNWGYTVTRIAGNKFQVVTASWNTVAVANVFQVGGRLKLSDTSTMYGTITEVSASSTVTNVTFTPDSGSLTASFSSVYNSIITPDLLSLPGGNVPSNVVRQNTAQIYAADGGATDSYVISMSPTVLALATGELILFKANTLNTGPATLNVDGLGAIPIVKQFNMPLITGDILAGQIVSVVYDGTNFQMQSQSSISGGGGSGFDKIVIQKFSTTGTYTPTTGMTYCQIEAWGAGGGGGGAASTAGNQIQGAGGGGAGSYSRTIASAGTIGVSQSVTIGAAGAAATAGGNNGGNGGDTSVGSLCIGKGGSGGVGAGFVGLGGAGGVAGTGDITGTGQSGFSGFSSGSTSVSTPTGGAGGSTLIGGGGAAVYTNTSQAGNAGTGFGAGGSGGATFNSQTQVGGGAGTAGYVIVTEYLIV